MQKRSKPNKTLMDKKFPATLVRIFTPVLLTIVLFIGTFFGWILPNVESRLMDRKREMINALTQSAWSTIDYYAKMAEKGTMTKSEAKTQAAEHLRSLRYGTENKDYFWINDMHPNIVMHPYRPELEGRDVTDFKDPTGKRLFVACVDIVRRNGSGYVDYQWQWLDNPAKIVPKISFVKGYAPWGWVIGTGVYVEDVRSQISAITRRWTLICLFITGVIILLGIYVIIQGAKAERLGRQIEAQARLQQEQLYQSAKLASLGTLVSGVAHEINNPLAAVMLNLQVFESVWQTSEPIMDSHYDDCEDFAMGGMPYLQLKERLPTLLNDAREGITRVKRIVGDLKEFAGIHPSSDWSDVDLNSAVEKAAGLVGSLIKKATSNFRIRYAPDLPFFRGNGQRIEQVAVNLLVNACQATAEKPIDLEIVTGYRQETREVYFKVKDTGIGMASEVLERITDPFYTTKRDKGGTGLGLSISHTIVKDHGGHLIFESHPGQGTTATVYLPIRSEDTHQEKSHGNNR